MILKSGRSGEFWSPPAVLAVINSPDTFGSEQVFVGQRQDGTVFDEVHLGPPLTPSERQEIAEALIARWRKWGGF